MANVIKGVDIAKIEDTLKLQDLLDSCDDFNERKKVRDRIREIRESQKEKTSQLVAHLENAGTENLEKKIRDEAEYRRKFLTKYDKMESPGKNMGIHLQSSIDANKKLIDQSIVSGNAPTLDNMQEGIKMRLSEAKERQSKILSSFEERARAPKLSETKQQSAKSALDENSKQQKPVLKKANQPVNVKKLDELKPVNNDLKKLNTKSKTTPETNDKEMKKVEDALKAQNLSSSENLSIINGVDISKINDILKLQDLLDVCDFEQRKIIRDQIRKIREVQKDATEKLLAHLENAREESIQKKLREGAAQRKHSLTKLTEMASPGQNMASHFQDAIQKTQNLARQSNLPHQLSQSSSPSLDTMQEGIKMRLNEAKERQNKILSSYDKMAKAPRDCKPFPTKVTPMNKFKQMDAENVDNTNKTMAKPASNVMRGSTDVKEMLLKWCRNKTKNYPNVEITNFSSSWSDGLAFCALIHHFFPDSFDYKKLDPKNRRQNFELAFKTAEEKADISSLLDPEDMVMMKNKPDWKCVFTYIQTIYRTLRTMD